jgi:hypothetical protein
MKAGQLFAPRSGWPASTSGSSGGSSSPML